jgi:hypothetical protein
MSEVPLYRFRIIPSFLHLNQRFCKTPASASQSEKKADVLVLGIGAVDSGQRGLDHRHTAF